MVKKHLKILKIIENVFHLVLLILCLKNLMLQNHLFQLKWEFLMEVQEVKVQLKMKKKEKKKKKKKKKKKYKMKNVMIYIVMIL